MKVLVKPIKLNPSSKDGDGEGFFTNRGSCKRARKVTIATLQGATTWYHHTSNLYEGLSGTYQDTSEGGGAGSKKVD